MQVANNKMRGHEFWVSQQNSSRMRGVLPSCFVRFTHKHEIHLYHILSVKGAVIFTEIDPWTESGRINATCINQRILLHSRSYQEETNHENRDILKMKLSVLQAMSMNKITSDA